MRNAPEYKKSSLKIGAKAAITKVHESSAAIVKAISLAHPTAAPLLQFAYHSFGGYLVYRQEELNEFTEYLMAHYTELNIDFNSKEFQEAAFIHLETYFKLRVKDKRLVAQEIFRNFCGSPDKPNFPLERYEDTLTKISVEGLKFLVFLEKDIFPLRNAEIEEKYTKGNYPLPPEGRSKKWWIDHFKKTEPISQYISKWVNTVYAPKIVGLPVDHSNRDYHQVQDKEDGLVYLSMEMEQLGIMHSISTGVVFGGGGNQYALTPYGKEFIDFIPEVI